MVERSREQQAILAWEDVPTVKSSIPKVLQYPNIVQVILLAPLVERKAFVMFLCVFGSGKMLISLISDGNDSRDEFIGFLRAAVIGRNHDTYETLSFALRQAGRLKVSIDLDLLRAF